VWLFALGALFVIVTLFLPKGIAGLVAMKMKVKAVQQLAPGNS
jgi:urea transport system permease protein